MNRSDLVAEVSRRASLPEPTARKVLDVLFGLGNDEGVIAAALREHQKVQVHGFGTWTAKPRAARQAKNPRTGEMLTIPARIQPSFRAALGFRSRLESKPG